MDCPSPQPLLPLSQLHVLQMNASTMAAPGLEQLSTTLKQLQTVRLCYDRDPAVIAAASAGWAGLPVKNLELRVYPGPVTTATIQQLAHLTGLTHLTIQVCYRCNICALVAPCMEVKGEACPVVPDCPAAVRTCCHKLQQSCWLYMVLHCIDAIGGDATDLHT